LRIGRGFTNYELKAAGISTTEAPIIGISVDNRRSHAGNASLTEKVARLNHYYTNGLLSCTSTKSKKRKLATIRHRMERNLNTKHTNLFTCTTQSNVELFIITDKARRAIVYRTIRIEHKNKLLEGKRTIIIEINL